MVVPIKRRYLCTAPRAEEWDDKAAALLKSMGGDQAKLGALLKRTLCQLQQVHKHEKRAGPGRKSNGEHAIAFYEYMLQDQNDDSESDEEEEEEPTVASWDSQEFLNEHDDTCEVCQLGGELLCCSTCSLSFHVKCVRPVLEALPEGDDWSCAYCVLNGSTGHKRHSKVYKSAAAAVRLMGRLRNQEERKQKAEEAADQSGDIEEATANEEEGSQNGEESDQQSESTNDKEKDDDEAKVGRDSSDKSSKDELDDRNLTAEEKAAKEKRRLLALSRLSDPWGKSDEIMEGRRNRRQPALYEPQDVPDSKWQTDEPISVRPTTTTSKNDTKKKKPKVYQSPESSATKRERPESSEKRKPESPDDSVPLTKLLGRRKAASEEPTPEASEKTAEASPGHKRNPTGELWCNFCKDDPNVPLCVFCACRVCFNKHDKANTLLCDECDDEYHIYCLKPPLKSIPAKKWLCATCSAPKKKATPTTPRKEASSVRTTTRKTAGTKTKTTPLAKRKSPGRTPKPYMGRPRGRPPKDKSPGSTGTSTPNSNASTPRKRGRPPKNPSPGAPSPAPRKRGRPPKSSYVTSPPLSLKSSTSGGSTTESNKKRAAAQQPGQSQSPAKKARIEATPDEVLAASVKTSRSGRVVKRNSFHDEIYEGEQHLSTFRSQTGQPPQLQPQSFQKKAPQMKIDSPKKAATSSAKPAITASKVAAAPKPTSQKPTLKSAAAPLPPVETQMPPARPIAARPSQMMASKVTNVEFTSLTPARMLKSPSVAGLPHQKAGTPTKLSFPSSTSALTMQLLAQELSAKKAAMNQQAMMPTSNAVVANKTGMLTAPSAPTSAVATKKNATSGVPTLDKSKSLQRPTMLKPSKTLTAEVKTLVEDTRRHVPVINPAPQKDKPQGPVKQPRRKPGARECMQISRRFGVRVIPQKYMEILMDYCTRGKVEHLIRMRERLDEHSRFLECQLASLETLIKQKGESTVVVPALPERAEAKVDTPLLGAGRGSTPTSFSMSPTNVFAPAEAPKQMSSNMQQTAPGAIASTAIKPTPIAAFAPRGPATVLGTGFATSPAGAMHFPKHSIVQPIMAAVAPTPFPPAKDNAATGGAVTKDKTIPNPLGPK